MLTNNGNSKCLFAHQNEAGLKFTHLGCFCILNSKCNTCERGNGFGISFQKIHEIISKIKNLELSTKFFEIQPVREFKCL